MPRSLIDSGPLIALFDKDDRYHEPVKKFLRNFSGRLYTSWPVLTEVCHLLDFNVKTQIDFLKWIGAGAVEVVELNKHHLERLIDMTEQYSDLPMDLADASMLIISEFKDIGNIITIDSDYYVYRTKNKRHLKNLFETLIKK